LRFLSCACSSSFTLKISNQKNRKQKCDMKSQQAKIVISMLHFHPKRKQNDVSSWAFFSHRNLGFYSTLNELKKIADTKAKIKSFLRMFETLPRLFFFSMRLDSTRTRVHVSVSSAVVATTNKTHSLSLLF
jgi:hypothetical protein